MPRALTAEIISMSGDVVISEDLGVLDAGVRQTWKFTASDKLLNGAYLYRVVSGKEFAQGVILFMR